LACLEFAFYREVAEVFVYWLCGGGPRLLFALMLHASGQCHELLRHFSVQVMATLVRNDGSLNTHATQGQVSDEVQQLVT
jgi:hypothetical protein